MGIKVIEVESLDQFITEAMRLRNEWTLPLTAFAPTVPQWRPWFRGHKRGDWKLKPFLYRFDSDLRPDVLSTEAVLRLEFKRIGIQLVNREPKTDWEWYFLMQHYGAPTRLLDWTDGALLALHFALSRDAWETEEAAVVWVMDPVWLNKSTLKNDGALPGIEDPKMAEWLPADTRNLKQEYPVAFCPTHVAPRVASQRSQFTIFGSNTNGLVDLAETDNNARLAKIEIPPISIRHVRIDLRTCGIYETSVFPDLDGLSRELIEQWLSKHHD
jgi:hypothetical protein